MCHHDTSFVLVGGRGQTGGYGNLAREGERLFQVPNNTILAWKGMSPALQSLALLTSASATSGCGDNT